MLAGGILLLVGVFIPGAVGLLGNLIRGFMLGTFGAGAFVLPVVLIALAVFCLVSRKISLPFIQWGLLSWLVLTFLHIISRFANPPPDYLGRFEYIGIVYSSQAALGGGVLGAVLGELLHSFLGVGTIIILVVGILILLVLLTGRSLVSLVGQGMEKAKSLYDGSAIQRYEEDDDDYEDEDEDDEEPIGYEEAPLSSRKPRILNPLPPLRKSKNKKPEFIEIQANGHEGSPKILLVQEELDAQKNKKGKNPLFERRSAVKREKVVSFPDKPETMVPYTESDAPPPIIKGLSEPEDIPPFDLDTPDEYYDSVSHDIKINSAETVREVDDINDEDDFNDMDNIALPVVRGGTPSDAPRFAPMPSYEGYKLPPITFLAKNDRPQGSAETRAQVHRNSLILEETLRNFRIEAKVVEVSIGPTVTRYDLAPGPGVKVSSIANLSNDLALSLAAQGIRIEAPVPGKSAVGIEIPNKDPQAVFLREILEDDRFVTFQSKLAFAVGKDIAGSPVVTDVARMPHMLIAGATGSGKSVCINTLIASLLYKSRPDEVKLLMIDPKVVELSVYNGIPHLLIPVVTDPKKASGALSWAVQEMENRYAAFAETGNRDLKGYNRQMQEINEQKLPQIVIIIDELADLMMTCKGEVEESICRLAQKARAAGIHLIVATQRPSVDVITGLIKANIPSRLAFAVSSGTDSRTVLDMYGAEKLLGKGDMLFLPMGQNKPVRIQGGFISDKEVESLVDFLKAQAPVEHTTDMIQQITMPGKSKVEGEVDEFFHDAVEFLLAKGKASTSMLQRQFRIGYNRASRLMDDLELRGIVGPEDGVKPRKVTITREEYREIYG